MGYSHVCLSNGEFKTARTQDAVLMGPQLDEELVVTGRQLHRAEQRALHVREAAVGQQRPRPDFVEKVRGVAADALPVSVDRERDLGEPGRRHLDVGIGQVVEHDLPAQRSSAIDDLVLERGLQLERGSGARGGDYRDDQPRSRA